MHCDGYAAYPSFANRSEGRITLAACWAHARRKFHEAQETPATLWVFSVIKETSFSALESRGTWLQL